MKTWDAVFERLGLVWCKGCTGPYDHGWYGYLGEGIVHWRDRRFTRPGLYKLLRKLTQFQNPSLDVFPTWRRLYLLNKEVLRLARDLGVRLPRSAFDLDRARLRLALSDYKLADRRRMTPSEQKDFRAALRWAARS